jgi:hypothetical protein
MRHALQFGRPEQIGLIYSTKLNQSQLTNRKSNHRSTNLGRGPGRLTSAKPSQQTKTDKNIHLRKFAPEPCDQALAIAGDRKNRNSSAVQTTNTAIGTKSWPRVRDSVL